MDQSFSKLVLTQQDCEGMEFVLEKANVTLGRATINEIVLLHDSKVSRHHARIDKRGAGFAIMDLGSTNGTYVNGNRVASSALSPGDVIKLGPKQTWKRHYVGQPSP